MIADNAQPSFESRELGWRVGEYPTQGTLAMPRGRAPLGAVVLVAGSGPTDRDWTTPLLPGSNGSGRLVAEALATAGYVTLRYDKLASGPHGRQNAQSLTGKISLESHRQEVAAAVEQLATAPGVDAGRLFALTSSEGALHALNYQVHEPRLPLAGLILTAPPGRAIGEVAHMQVAAQLAAVPDGDRYVRLYDEAIARFVAGEPINPDPAMPESFMPLLLSLETPANLPFARELWVTDAADWLPLVDVPVLVVIGQKDIQVDWQADGEPLARAVTGRSNVKFVFPPSANHVLKHEAAPRAELNAQSATTNYNNPEGVLDPEAIQAILDWLSAR